MMIAFWLSSLSLLLISIIVIVKTILKKNDQKEQSQNSNISLYNQKILEIDKDIENKTITSEEAENIKKELDKSLSEHNEKSKFVASSFYHSSNASKKIVSIILILIIPVFALSIYNIIGSPDSIKKLAHTENVSNKKNINDELASVDEMVGRVERRVLDNPNNADDWLMLANSYVALKRYPDAIRAYENLYRLQGNNPSLLLRYADTLAIANSGIFVGKPAAMIKKALELDPENTMGLWLAGLVAYEEGEIKEAISYWQKVLPRLEEGSEEKKNIKKYIQFASENNNITLEENTLKSSNQNRYSLNLNINLSPEFNYLDKNKTVFIYAKSKDITDNMPIIVLRKKVADLPLIVQLDDSMSMIPSKKLSSYQSVRVIARVSKSGNAKTEKGDPIGIVDSVSTTSTKEIKLLINKKEYNYFFQSFKMFFSCTIFIYELF